MHILVIVIALTVILLTMKLNTQRKKAGVKGWVVGQDLDGRSDRIYRDAKTGISCKPDVVERGRIVEYKSAVVNGRARPSDVLQVAAQMIATKAETAELRYGNDQKFTYGKNSPQMKAAMRSVGEIIKQMKWHLCNKAIPQGKPSEKKCGTCYFRRDCPDADRGGCVH